MRLKKTKTKGVTLAELLVALFLLAAVIGPVMGMFVWSTQTSIKAYKLSIAAVVAQMRMEELVGEETIVGGDFTDKGFNVKIDVNNNVALSDLDADLQTALGGSDVVSQYASFLKMVTVTVYDNDGTTVLCTQKNIINTATNGFVNVSSVD